MLGADVESGTSNGEFRPMKPKELPGYARQLAALMGQHEATLHLTERGSAREPSKALTKSLKFQVTDDGLVVSWTSAAGEHSWSIRRGSYAVAVHCMPGLLESTTITLRRIGSELRIELTFVAAARPEESAPA